MLRFSHWMDFRAQIKWFFSLKILNQQALENNKVGFCAEKRKIWNDVEWFSWNTYLFAFHLLWIKSQVNTMQSNAGEREKWKWENSLMKEIRVTSTPSTTLGKWKKWLIVWNRQNGDEIMNVILIFMFFSLSLFFL